MYAKSSKLEFKRSSTKMVTGAFPSGLLSPDAGAMIWVSGASNENMGCGALSSVMVKSSFVSPLTTGRPFLSSTVTSRKTKADVTPIFAASEDCCWPWALSSGKIDSRKAADRNTPRSFIVLPAPQLASKPGTELRSPKHPAANLATLLRRKSLTQSYDTVRFCQLVADSWSLYRMDFKP